MKRSATMETTNDLHRDRDETEEEDAQRCSPDLRPHEYISSNALVPSSKAAELTTAVWKSSFLVGLLRLSLSAQESLISTGGPLISSSCACSDTFGQITILDRERCPLYITYALRAKTSRVPIKSEAYTRRGGDVDCESQDCESGFSICVGDKSFQPPINCLDL